MEFIHSRVQESDWKALIDRIKKGKCLLLIGPECFSDCSSSSLLDTLAQEMGKAHGVAGGRYRNVLQSMESLLGSAQDYDITDLSIQVSEYYKRHQDDHEYQLYDQLAELPFHLIISSTHDDMLYRALLKKRKQVHYDYYSLHGNQRQIDYKVSAETPLYYNLYGSVENTDSLILTESQLLELLVAIIKGDPMLPSYITEQIKNTPSILFLGFGLKEWYLKVLLHVLRNEKNDSRSFAFEQFSQMVNIENQSIFYYYNSGHKISMYDLSPTEFVQELTTRYLQSVPADTGASGTQEAVEVKSAPGQGKPKIFLCHSHGDRALAVDLYNRLSAIGFDPWIDKENIEYGDYWDQVIVNKIKNEAHYFIVLNTPNLNQRIESYAHFEIQTALRRKTQFAMGIRFIIPIVYQNSPLLPALADIQGAIAEDNSFFDRLVNTIRIDWMKRGQGLK